ncbi:MAG: hypothetical protein HC906_15225 [Bacteroidales bacterium]|nr:hypothetical protein [Bacteroidales bacterium]
MILQITYRINKKKHASIWALQVKNILGSPLVEGFEYNYRIQSIVESKTIVVLPVLSYKIEF